MIHFAYPNVIPKESRFIGCGRYGVFTHNEIPEGYREAETAPPTPNKNDLLRAAEILAPESYDSPLHICEFRDETEYPYRGDSLDFAWVLAHVSRSRQLGIREYGDIWCTGVIKVQEPRPMLYSVLSEGFDLKLKAFLSDENHDRLFLVPMTNITKVHGDQIADAGAQVLSIGDLQQKGFSRLQKKTVLKVPSDGLPQLVKLLFEKKKIPPPVPGWPVLLIFLCLALAAGGIYLFRGEKISARVLLTCLEQGEFSRAEKMMAKADPENGEIQRIREQMSAPLHAEIFFQFQKPGQKPSDYIPADSQTVRETILTHRDNYRLHIGRKSGNSPVWLYVFQKDQQGYTDRLFPHLLWKPLKENPLYPEDFPCRIPPDPGEWLWLDEITARERELPDETLYIIASFWKAGDVEELFKEIQGETDSRKRREFMDRFIRQMEKRKEAGLPSVFFEKITFRHGS